MLKIYNTLTRTKQEFIPLEPGKIKMYVCGPTVYDVPHIGHARSAYVFDVIRRYLEYRGFDVFFVRNITDVDDKIINKALGELGGSSGELSEGLLKSKVSEVAERYTAVYHTEMARLGIVKPSSEPRATENIKEMVRFIEVLVEKGYAYVSGGTVYFSVSAFPSYGKLSHQDTDQMMHGARVESDENKRHPLDFALWKEAKENEPFWPSPWGNGRPGWHIECSVMSTNLLGLNFDIHGGGLDLIFPHHENEIAQAEAVTGKKFANYWMHNGLLTVNGEKMSKSLGNYTTIVDFLSRYKDPDILKITFLMSHYRSPVDYNEAKLVEARASKERIMIFLDKAGRFTARIENRESKIDFQDELKQKFIEAMDDDFNTPLAFSSIFEAIHAGNEIMSSKDRTEKERDSIIAIRDHVLEAAGVLGLELVVPETEGIAADEIKKLIAERENARRQKDFKKADQVREALKKMGVVLEDTPEGTIWRKS